MAVLTVAAFLSKWEALFPTTGNREITASRMRDFRQDIADSFQPVAGQTTVESWKSPCAVATTGNITLSGEQTIDGVLTSGSRVLVKNQTTQSQNGIYVSAAGAWSRSTDADAGSELEGAAVGVTQGTTQQNTVWLQTSDSINLGTTAIVWQQIGYGAGSQNLASVLSAGNDGAAAQIKNIADPTAAQDAATKAYVDTAASNRNTDTSYYLQTDFLAANYFENGFALSTQNGANFANNTSYGIDNTEHALGVHEAQTGINSAGGCKYLRGTYKFGFGHTFTGKWRSALTALSDGTNTYTAIVGLTDAGIGSFGTTPDGIYFKYTHSVNSGNWQCITRSGGTETNNNSAVAASASYQILEIRINSDITSIGFYIDGALVQTHTTNIPASTAMWMQAMIVKSAGTTSRGLAMDYYEEVATRTTAR